MLVIQLFPRTEENAYEENVENGTTGEIVPPDTNAAGVPS